MITDHDRDLMAQLYDGGNGLMPCEIGKKFDITTAECRQALGLTSKDHGRRWTEQEKAACIGLINEAVTAGGTPNKDVISQQLEAQFGRTFHPLRVANYIRLLRPTRSVYSPRDRARFVRIANAHPVKTLDQSIRAFQRATGKTLKVSTAKAWLSRYA